MGFSSLRTADYFYIRDRGITSKQHIHTYDMYIYVCVCIALYQPLQGAWYKAFSVWGPYAPSSEILLLGL